MPTLTPVSSWPKELKHKVIRLFFCCVIVGCSLLFLAIKGQNLYLQNSLNQRTTLTANHINSFLTRQLTTAVTRLGRQPHLLLSTLHQIPPDHKPLTTELATVRDVLSAAIVYVMDKEGVVTASTASNKSGKTLTGNNYRFRPYFTSGMAGKSSCYPALGVTTNKRGLYFSAPIPNDTGVPAGVAVIKSGLEQISDILDHSLPEISLLLSDKDIVFATSNGKEEWLYHARTPLSPAKKQEIKQSRQFADSPINNLPVDLNQAHVALDEMTYMVVSVPIDLPGWSLCTLQQKQSVYPAVFSIGFLTLFVSYLLIMNLLSSSMGKNLETGMASEIKQRKRVQTQLQDSESRYRTLFENSQDATLLLDPPHFIDCNGAALHLFGYDSKEELFNTHPGKLSPPLQEDGSRSTEKAEEMMDTAIRQGSHKFQWRHLHRDRTPFWAEVSTTPITLQGRTHLHTIIRDITEKKYEEEQLQLYFRAVSQSIDGICITTMDGVMQYTNQAWDSMHGYRSEEQLGKNLALHHTDTKMEENLASMLKEVVRVGHMIKMIAHRKKDRSEFQTLTSVTALLDKEGAASGFLVISRDITESLAVKQKSRALTQAVDQNFDGIVMTDLNQKILLANTAWATMHGFSNKDSLVGQQLTIFHTTEQNEKELALFLKMVWKKGHHHDETGHLRQDGSIFQAAMNISLFRDEHREPIGLLVTARDISLQKETEQSLIRAKEEAEAANQAKGEFLANMSHEIRTPMNGIMGMTRLLMESPLSPEQLNRLQMVESSATRLLGIINDILDFSKIEAGKLQLEEVQFSLTEKIDELFSLMTAKADKRHVALIKYISKDIPAYLTGDPTRLLQVLINLVNNGLKFTEKGSVSLTVGLQELTDKDCFLHFSIRDTGIGIPKEKQSLIFESFSQADTSHTRKYGGTGLGLSISTQLCRLMGGEIGLTSEEGMGATFWFTSRFKLPLAADKKESNERGTVLQSALSRQEILQGKKILLVEDEFVNRTLAQALLKQQGIQTISAINGREAVERFRKENFDAILMDIQMPKLDGYQTAAAVRAHEKIHGGHIPIIAMTAHAMQGDRERCLTAGMDDYLSKPLEPEIMFLAIERQMVNSVLIADEHEGSRAIAAKIFMDMGWQVILTEKGQQAISQCARCQFNLILMDMQMPELDCLEATRQIREREQETGRHTWIIALSEEKRDAQYLTPGMDGFLAKPVTAAKLQENLEKLSIRQYGEKRVENLSSSVCP